MTYNQILNSKLNRKYERLLGKRLLQYDPRQASQRQVLYLQVAGTLTLMQEGQSWGSTLKDGAWYIFLIGLVIFAILCFYVVDYKKGTQKDVIDRIGSISNNFTMLGIVNGSVEAAEELKEIVRATFLANSGKTEELKEWVANKTGTFYSEIKSTIGTAING